MKAKLKKAWLGLKKQFGYWSVKLHALVGSIATSIGLFYEEVSTYVPDVKALLEGNRLLAFIGVYALVGWWLRVRRGDHKKEDNNG